MSSDPLSFFAGEDSSDTDSEGEDGNANGNRLNEDLCDEAAATNKLPSPDSLFATVKTPTFLNSSGQKDINWDHFVKNDADDVNIHLDEEGAYAAIAPPKGMDDGSNHNRKVHSSLSAAIVRTYSNTSGEISAPPVRYTTQEVDAKFRTVSDTTSSSEPRAVGGVSSGKRDTSSNPAEEDGSETKKQKTENFRQKEKRKRNLGQTSRGTSYVEEEKRVLRQQFATDEVMN